MKFVFNRKIWEHKDNLTKTIVVLVLRCRRLSLLVRTPLKKKSIKYFPKTLVFLNCFYLSSLSINNNTINHRRCFLYITCKLVCFFFRYSYTYIIITYHNIHNYSSLLYFYGVIFLTVIVFFFIGSRYVI